MHQINLGWTPLHKFGHNPDVDTGAAEDVWDAGGDYPWPAAAAATTIVSASTDDAAEGTGARTVRVQGLDANYLLKSEVATLDGTTPVTLANQYVRVFRAWVATAGSGGVNAGNLQIKHSSTVIGQITANFGQTLMAIYTTPADYTYAALTHWYVTLGRAVTTVAQVALQVRPFGGAWLTRELVDVSNTTSWDWTYPIWLEIGPKADFRVRVLSVSANNTLVSAGFGLALSNNG